MAKIGILTFSDGRESVASSLIEMNTAFQRRLHLRLEAAGHSVVAGTEPIWTSELAQREAKRLAATGCDCTIFNYAVWAFPHFTAIASRFAPSPFMLFSNVNPEFPGLVAMLAAAGTLDQLGQHHARAWGEIENDAVFAKVNAFARAAKVTRSLRGKTYGHFGGRPMGMYTAVANTDQWMRQFGVDVEHVDQGEIVRLAADVPARSAVNGRRWIESWGNVHYDGRQLTPELLERQVRAYYATRALIEQRHLDFCGIKAQPELTDTFCTMDVAEAFLNDSYDWDGPKPIIVCATEADMDAALTMEILSGLAETPALFADVRHYHADRGIFDLVNSGEHATYFAAKSTAPEENMPLVHFYPQGFYFPAGGASVQSLAAPGDVTFARLMRREGRYWMAILTGQLVQYDRTTNEALMHATTFEWPHAFARFETAPERFLASYASNHIHAVYGNWVEELRHVCDQLEVEPVLYT